MNNLTIREAKKSDVPAILQFIRELAEYERAPDAVIADEAAIEKGLFAANSSAYGLLCECDGKPIGFAVYFYNFSTWLGKNGLYLEDLYVTPESRGKGAGLALLKHLAGIAVAKDCGRFEWSVLDWNEPAIKFYEAFGAKAQTEWLIYRMDGETLKNFASS